MKGRNSFIGKGRRWRKWGLEDYRGFMVRFPILLYRDDLLEENPYSFYFHQEFSTVWMIKFETLIHECERL